MDPGLPRHHPPTGAATPAGRRKLTSPALDTWLTAKHATSSEFGAAAIASLALLLRRHFPLTVLAITLPSLAISESVVPVLVALYTVALHHRNRWLLTGCAAIVALGYATPWPPMQEVSRDTVLLGLIYATMTAAAPVFLGLLTRTSKELASRIDEVELAREQEQLLIEQTTLARERTQLAREMHDVVSHQVSLIAVSAGALQVGAPDAGTKDAASTIRELSVTTLDELRHMVTLLRASGSRPTELTPQPTLADLDRLIDTSGIAAELHGELPADVGAPQQRAIYRTIQEALTNARKHAPGARVNVHIGHCDGELSATVENGRPTRPTLSLPSAQHGLVGLRERAELLDGAFEAGPTPDGGYRVHLRLPASEGCPAGVQPPARRRRTREEGGEPTSMWDLIHEQGLKTHFQAVKVSRAQPGGPWKTADQSELLTRLAQPSN